MTANQKETKSNPWVPWQLSPPNVQQWLICFLLKSGLLPKEGYLDDAPAPLRDSLLSQSYRTTDRACDSGPVVLLPQGATQRLGARWGWLASSCMGTVTRKMWRGAGSSKAPLGLVVMNFKWDQLVCLCIFLQPQISAWEQAQSSKELSYPQSEFNQRSAKWEGQVKVRERVGYNDGPWSLRCI